MSLAFVFVFQGGAIEPKAALLAASLREFMLDDVELVAAVPVYESMQPPSTLGLDFLASINIRTEEIDNVVDRSYPIANKISAIGVPVKASSTVFLDSDILCLRGLQRSDTVLQSEFAARLADFREMPHSVWAQVYEHLECGAVNYQYESLVEKQAMPLYFNSGVVATTKAAQLKRNWAAFATKLNDPERWPICRPFLDQMSLPFAAQELGCSLTIMEPLVHWSSAIFPIDKNNPPLFIHYHDSSSLVGDSVAGPIASRLVNKYSALSRLLRTDPWLRLL